MLLLINRRPPLIVNTSIQRFITPSLSLQNDIHVSLKSSWNYSSSLNTVLFPPKSSKKESKMEISDQLNIYYYQSESERDPVAILAVGHKKTKRLQRVKG